MQAGVASQRALNPLGLARPTPPSPPPILGIVIGSVSAALALGLTALLVGVFLIRRHRRRAAAGHADLDDPVEGSRRAPKLMATALGKSLSAGCGSATISQVRSEQAAIMRQHVPTAMRKLTPAALCFGEETLDAP